MASPGLAVLFPIFGFTVGLIEELFHIRREKEPDKLLHSWPHLIYSVSPHRGGLRALFSAYEMYFNKNLTSVPAGVDSLGTKR